MDKIKDYELDMDNFTEEQQVKIIEFEAQAKTTLKRFQRAKAVDPERENEIVENVAFFEGKQYKLESYKGGRPHEIKMRVPHASTAIKTRVASLISSRYKGTLFPYREEDSKAVKALGDILDDEFLRDNTSSKINKCVELAAVTRSSYLHVLWDEDIQGIFQDDRKGAIKTYIIDKPQSVFIDPEALSLKKANWVIITSRISKEEAIASFPETDFILKSLRGTSFTPQERGESYISNKDYSTEQEGVLTRFDHYYKKWTGERYIIVRQVVIEKYLVKETELDGLTTFPIAQMKWEDETSSPYGRALMDDLLSLQKAINTIESSITSVAVSYSAPSYILSQNSGIDPKKFAQLVSVPGVVFRTKSSLQDTVTPINVPALDSSIISTKQEYIQEIDRIAGITNPYLGSIGTAGNTAQGTQMAIERARIIEATVLANIESFVRDITEIIIEYIKSQYSGISLTTREVSIEEGSVKWNTVELDSSIEDIQYDFYIDIESQTPYNREREKEKLFEVWQAENQYQVSAEERLITPMDLLEANGSKDLKKFKKRDEEKRIWSAQTKAEAATNLVNTANELGMDEGILQAALQDLIIGGDNHPSLDAFLAQAQELRMTMEQQQNQGLQEVAQTLVDTGQDPTPAIEALAEINAPTD